MHEIGGYPDEAGTPARRRKNKLIVPILAAMAETMLTAGSKPERQYNCPARKTEDAAVKKKRKLEAKSQKVNRQRAGKKRKFSGHKKKK